ncbi:DUF6492 family protein [Paenibacillus thalictri]|uniref:Nucleotide-diphospho-sugar transferase domain-containing protein n=1 Tax=Paenibacillus thalictri TaxID=2527873 RepID=A0A4Q9DLP9_9BACL|nr:DUF6492 family protein [Paenibacillus thalictri]TBL72450.1 hypothetical protein EYB31_29155 [Paenibacillus thalictri]
MVIDVIIPAIEKDLGTLPLVIDSVRKHVTHTIGEIIVVSPESEKIKAMCARKNCRFVNENTVLPITKKDIRYSSAKWERSGWMYQQLLKLGSTKLTNRKFYLTIDADTILLRPHTFRANGKTVFFYRNWSQPEYFVTYRKLLGKKRSSSKSFVAHYMLFEKAKVVQLKKAIEARHQTPWYKAILNNFNRKKQFAFSEFETYGNFLHSQNPGQIKFKTWLNKSSGISTAQLTPGTVKKLSSKFRSISLHKRKWYARKAK